MTSERQFYGDKPAWHVMIVLFLLHSLLVGLPSFPQFCRRVFLVVIRKIETHGYLKDESEEAIRIQTRLQRMIETNGQIESLFPICTS